jgi:hypothetical protein
MIENGFVLIPETAPWLAEYLHELTVFPKGKHDDQADSTAQFLDWFTLRVKAMGILSGCIPLRENAMSLGSPHDASLGPWRSSCPLPFVCG